MGLLCFSTPFSFAQQSGDFAIDDIRLEGLRRFSPGIIFSRLPVAIGDTLSAEKTTEIIDVLYETGYFRTVEVLRDGDILVIRVEENPTIAEVTVGGASELSEDALTSMLEGAGLVKSGVFNRSVMEEAAKVIEDVYVEKNFYHVEVDSVVSPLPRNRVAILFNVTEGSEAAIRSIEIIGNTVFSDWRLSRDMRLEPRGLFNILTDNYRFSESKLGADLSRIRTRYLQEGYLRFNVEARQVEVSEDKKHIDIIIRISEGRQFAISDIRIETPPGLTDLGFDAEDFMVHVEQEVGNYYSGRISGQTIAKIKKDLGDIGYASANVRLDTDIDDESGEVALTYLVNPGNVTFVRRIDIYGNEVTADEIIRRELLQFEQERYSAEKIDRSRSRVRRLGYFDSVSINTVPVPDSADQIDLRVEVVEAKTGEFSIGAGFSTDGGVNFNVGLTQSNIFGTGNDFSFKYSQGDDSKKFNIALDEHYHTKDGVSRHMALDYGETDAGSDSSSYSIDGYKFEYGYVFPFTDDGKYNVYGAYQQVDINSPGSIHEAYQDFIREYGSNFDTLLLLSGLTYDTRDAASVPTEGQRIQVDGELALPILRLEYYHVDYQHDYYYTFRGIPTDPVMHARFGYGYGDAYAGGVYPFYRRYYLGGTRTLRGFSSNSIGYADDASNRALGGQSRIYGSVEWSTDFDLFENQKVYLVPFIDGGAVGEKLGLGSFRSSLGLEIRWRSPVGPLRFSYVEILKSKPRDDVEKFQFSVSTF